MDQQAKKTEKRVTVLNRVFDVITNPEVYNTINYRKLDESRIKQYLHQPLQRLSVKLLMELGGYVEPTAKM